MIRTYSYQWVAIGAIACLLLACSAPNPQRPSRRMGQTPQVDSAQLALMELNMQLAQTADEQVLQAATAQEEPYALYEGQVWMHILDRGDCTLTPPQQGQTCTIHMRIYTLDNRLLEDSEGTYVVGKNELPQGVEMNIHELYPGGKARMYVPWYTAYGMQGTVHIPPYENVIIEIELR